MVVRSAGVTLGGILLLVVGCNGKSKGSTEARSTQPSASAPAVTPSVTDAGAATAIPPRYDPTMKDDPSWYACTSDRDCVLHQVTHACYGMGHKAVARAYLQHAKRKFSTRRMKRKCPSNDPEIRRVDAAACRKGKCTVIRVASSRPGYVSIPFNGSARCLGGDWFVDGEFRGRYPVKRAPVAHGKRVIKIRSGNGHCAGQGTLSVDIWQNREHVLPPRRFRR